MKECANRPVQMLKSKVEISFNQATKPHLPPQKMTGFDKGEEKPSKSPRL